MKKKNARTDNFLSPERMNPVTLTGPGDRVARPVIRIHEKVKKRG